MSSSEGDPQANHATGLGFFNHSRHTQIFGGQFNLINRGKKPRSTPFLSVHRDLGERSPLLLLGKAAVITATHDAGHEFQRPGCHRNTRVSVLRRLKDWIIGFEEPEAIFLWLCGDAGAGKSSIAQSLCAQLAQEGQLLGSFFFWRNDPERSTHIALVATLVYQAVIALPGLGDLVAAVVEQDPAIFNKHFKIQLISLLINPINTLISTTDINPSSIPSVIVIDGLDECSGRDIQCSLLSSLACAIPKCNLRLRVLISSRPEVEIKSVFNSKPLLDLSCRLALHASFETDTDIRKFLVDTFDNIKRTHPLKSHILPSWPGGDVIYQLVQRSSGQFIFASTVGRYISEPRQKPQQQLDIIMGVRPPPTEVNLPYTELNAIYTHLLSCIPPDRLEMVLDILGLIFIVRPALPFPSGSFGDFGFKFDRTLLTFLSLDSADLEFYLIDLSSVIQVEGDQDPSQYRSQFIKICHASLGDFLLDPRRSQQFYRKPQVFFAKMAGVCTERMNDIPNESSSLQFYFEDIHYLFNLVSPVRCYSSLSVNFCWFTLLLDLLKHAEFNHQLCEHLMSISLPILMEQHRGHTENFRHFLDMAIELLALTPQTVSAKLRSASYGVLMALTIASKRSTSPSPPERV